MGKGRSDGSRSGLCCGAGLVSRIGPRLGEQLRQHDGGAADDRYGVGDVCQQGALGELAEEGGQEGDDGDDTAANLQIPDGARMAHELSPMTAVGVSAGGGGIRGRDLRGGAGLLDLLPGGGEDDRVDPGDQGQEHDRDADLGAGVKVIDLADEGGDEGGAGDTQRDERGGGTGRNDPVGGRGAAVGDAGVVPDGFAHQDDVGAGDGGPPVTGAEDTEHGRGESEDDGDHADEVLLVGDRGVTLGQGSSVHGCPPGTEGRLVLELYHYSIAFRLCQDLAKGWAWGFCVR